MAGQTANTGVAQLAAGTQEQQTQQAIDLANYQYEQAVKGYPIQLTQLAAQDISGLSGAYGSNTTTTPPQPSLVSGLAGLGVFGLGAGSLYNAYQASDRRLKEDIKVIGKTKDGQTIYRFRFKGHPQWHIGLMAQDVEKKRPEAVKDIGGYKAIDIKKATDAAARFAGGRVQGLQTGGIPAMPYGGSPISGLGPMPYSGGSSYIPQSGAVNMPKAAGGGSWRTEADNSSKMFRMRCSCRSWAVKVAVAGLASAPRSQIRSIPSVMRTWRPRTAESTGGRVPRAYGGLALPSSNRINVPTRGGLGMPSSMVMRRDAGGSADMSDASTSAGTDVPPLNPMMANITYGLYGEAAPYGQGMAEGRHTGRYCFGRYSPDAR